MSQDSCLFRFKMALLLPFVFLIASFAVEPRRAWANAATEDASAHENKNNRQQADSQSFLRRFANPPAEFRIIKIIHGWPDDYGAQDAIIRRLGQQGFGGVVCNVSFADYLESDTKWKAFTRAVKESKKAGFALWLYDEKGYPSGTAGGLTLKGHPEWEAQGLLISDHKTNGGAVTLDVPPGELIIAAAYPVQNGIAQTDKAIDLSTKVSGAQLSWQAPEGQWHVMAITRNRLYEGTHAALNLSDKLPYINFLMPEPTARFIELTHQQYAERLGDDLSEWFVATFTDEPSLMSLLLQPMPYCVLPWAPNLPIDFEKRHGYRLEPVIPALAMDNAPQSQRARYDFWKTVGELVAENFFGQIQIFCRAHNIPSGGHLLMEEDIVSHVPLYGDFFQCLRRLDAPSIDCLTSLPNEVPWFIARLASSAADLQGNTITMSETSDHIQRFRFAGDKRPVRTVTEAEIRGTCNRLILSGINTITSYYTFAGLDDDQLCRLNDWIGRCCLMLRGGHQAADIAVVYPAESIWPRFKPSRHRTTDSLSAMRIDHVFRAVSQKLYEARRDFTYIDSQALIESEIDGGFIVHGKLRWQVVVLPCADTLPMAAWEKLAQFVRCGGVLIACGALPANSERDFPSPPVRALAKEIFGGSGTEPRTIPNAAGGVGIFLPAGMESLLPIAIGNVLEAELATADSESPLRITHRRINGSAVYFVINDSAKPWAGQISLAASGTGALLDPASGNATQLNNAQNISLDLNPYGGVLLKFQEARPLKRLKTKSGPLPPLVLRSFAKVKPAVLRGQFVQDDLVMDNVQNSNVQQAWTATGAITKTGVDTFLFVRFQYPECIDLSDLDALVFETQVPEGQQTPSELLVILQEKDGGDYLAATGRSLGAPGRDTTYVSLDKFRLAGWSNDADDKLDLSRIAEIRVGWGGYFGTEGEKVQFSISLPRGIEKFNKSNVSGNS